MVRNGEVGRIIQKNNDGSGRDSTFDNSNNRIWDDREIATGPDEKVADVKLKLNGENQTRSAANSVDYSAIGQIFGSAIGRAIAGNNNQFLSLTAGTVAGFVGQKFVQALINGPGAIDLANVDLHDVFFGQGVSLAGAGLGAASSFLTAEIATSIGLEGVGAQMFNAAVGGYLGSVLNQVRQQGFNVLTAGIDWNVALHASEVNISSAIGSLLAHQFRPAESEFGAVGGQLAGAIGSALAYSFSVTLGAALNVFLPGVGAFFGTIIGTIIGDIIAGDPGYPKSVHDIQILASDPLHFQNRFFGSDDHGNEAVSQEMGDQVVKIANSFLDAVDGAAISYSGKVMIGYNAGAAPYSYITGWFPNGTGPVDHFASAADAIQQGVRQLLMDTLVIGGDLLAKRAQQAFIRGPHAAPNEIASDFTDLATLGGDLRTAQDYQQYLNDRETINALIQLYPESAFTAGWAATFARVQDLGLNHVNASDFLGGLVGWLDSLKKAGLVFDAAGVSYNQTGSTALIDIKVANGTEVPGALSVFADQLSQSSDATGTTLHFVLTNGLVPLGFQGPSSTTLVSGEWQVRGSVGNNIWFGTDSAVSIFNATGNGNDILIGGAASEHIHAGQGWNFIDGGNGSDWITSGSGSDILHGGRGGDYLEGGGGNDSYTFNRGDGADTVVDHYSYMVLDSTGSPAGPNSTGGPSHEFHDNGGADSLAFGPGIRVSDVSVHFGGAAGADLIVDVRDPANPGAAPTDMVTLLGWGDWRDRVETFVFADGTALNVGASLGAYQVPFGASLSRSSVVEKSAIGTAVGTVAGFDFAPNAVLTYSFANGTGGPFAIDASTGVITVAAAINYEATTSHSYDITVRTADQYGNAIERPFTINVIDIPNRAPVLSVPASSITMNAGQSLQVSTLFSAVDADNDALTYYFQDGAAANSGHFVLNGSAYANGAHFGVSAAQLAGQSYVAGAGGVADDISMQLSDGAALSAIGGVHVNVVNHAPVLTVPAGNIKANPGQTLQVSSLFSAADADGDALAYYFWDSSAAANSGRFVLNGTPIAANTSFAVSAAQLSQLTFVAGAAGSFDELSMQLWDGHAVSAVGHFHVDAAAPTPSDFNGDGKSDLLLLNDTSHGLYVCLMNGAAIGANALSFTIAATSGWHYQGLGDFDGDRKSDILLLNYTSAGVYVCEMNGTQLGTNAQAFMIDSPAGWHFQCLGDFNGDGKSDVLLMNSISNGIYVCEMNGIALATHGWSFNVNAADGWHFQDLGDFNGDGKSDIMLMNDVTHGIYVCEMDGTVLASQGWSFNVNAAAGWHFQDLADFNGDGKTDILLMNDATRGVYVCQMDGSHMGASGQAGTMADGWHFADTGDFNGDGKADLLLLNDTTRGAMVWQMNGTQVQATAQVGTVPAGYHYMGQGDYNGDAKTDLVFQNDATRAEQLWQMNGTGILENSQMVVLAAGWHLVI